MGLLILVLTVGMGASCGHCSRATVEQQGGTRASVQVRSRSQGLKTTPSRSKRFRVAENDFQNFGTTSSRSQRLRRFGNHYEAFGAALKSSG